MAGLLLEPVAADERDGTGGRQHHFLGRRAEDRLPRRRPPATTDDDPIGTGALGQFDDRRAVFADRTPDLVVDVVVLEDVPDVVDRGVTRGHLVGVDLVDGRIELEAVEDVVVLAAGEHVRENDRRVGGVRYLEGSLGQQSASVGITGTDSKQYCL